MDGGEDGPNSIRGWKQLQSFQNSETKALYYVRVCIDIILSAEIEFKVEIR